MYSKAEKEMLSIVKQFPPDGKTRLIPGYAMRGVHLPANNDPICGRSETAYAEIRHGEAVRSMLQCGKWTRIDSVAFCFNN